MSHLDASLQNAILKGYRYYDVMACFFIILRNLLTGNLWCSGSLNRHGATKLRLVLRSILLRARASILERLRKGGADEVIIRFYGKKTTFDTLTQNDINRLAEWMNRYPRRIELGTLHTCQW